MQGHYTQPLTQRVFKWFDIQPDRQTDRQTDPGRAVSPYTVDPDSDNLNDLSI